MDKHEDRQLEIALLGGGCFWCLEPAFSQLDGVEQVLPGYAGGKLESPSYEEVCAGHTGHIEVVQIRFDPQRIDFEELLAVFFAIHDPTTLDRQGNDVGTQYASVIFYQSQQQRTQAEAMIQKVAQLVAMPVVTQLRAASRFWPAEMVHHEYYERNPQQGYCRVVIEPKLRKFREQFRGRLKKVGS